MRINPNQVYGDVTTDMIREHVSDKTNGVTNVYKTKGIFWLRKFTLLSMPTNTEYRSDTINSANANIILGDNSDTEKYNILKYVSLLF